MTQISKPSHLLTITLAACVLSGQAVAQRPTPPTHAENHSDSRPAPRRADGTVDLGGDGIWSLPWITDFGAQLVGREDVPFLPWTKAMYDYNASNNVAYDPQGFCLPPGGPRAMGTPYPAEIIQQDDRAIIIFEGGAHVWREIFMDGRELPPLESLNPTYFGYSVGWYEDNGDTMVVESHGFNEKTWLNFGGYMHTDALHVVERYSRPDYDTLHFEATLTDPEAYTAPWTIAWDINWSEGAELAEYICQENNKFLIDLTDELGNPFFSNIDP